VEEHSEESGLLWLYRTMNNRQGREIDKLRHDKARYRETISTLTEMLKNHGLWGEAVERLRAKKYFDTPLDK